MALIFFLKSAPAPTRAVAKETGTGNATANASAPYRESTTKAVGSVQASANALTVTDAIEDATAVRRESATIAVAYAQGIKASSAQPVMNMTKSSAAWLLMHWGGFESNVKTSPEIPPSSTRAANFTV